MGIAGVAIGTLVAQWAGFVMSLLSLRSGYAKEWHTALSNTITKLQSHTEIFTISFFSANRDIFLRTLCLVSVNLFFTAAGSRQGAMMLSVNTLLMTFFTLFSYVMDGFANAGETLSGHHYGARDSKLLHATVRKIFGWGIILSLLFFFLYLLAGRKILSLFSNDPLIIQLAGHYIGWSICIPLISMAAFIWDGILIGLTQTRAMLLTLIIATGIYFALLHFAGHLCSDTNQSLWLAFTTYLFTRSFIQTIIWPKVCRQTGISYSKA
jgi:MATE family multidrug resistance protein